MKLFTCLQCCGRRYEKLPDSDTYEEESVRNPLVHNSEKEYDNSTYKYINPNYKPPVHKKECNPEPAKRTIIFSAGREPRYEPA